MSQKVVIHLSLSKTLPIQNAASGSILTELVFFEDSLISSLRDRGKLMSGEAFRDAPCSNELYMGFWEDRGLIP
ncbi:hypothetical protein CEXT_268181 [Caerostris extrusa]|uniref:Uncharacterized protein n=1 Tax=Caerostris extrusa TaxID=172846 RepID=A0AAV4W615_CAEEX|nr:hypothetical protein CEXT_268181 [Caerostris extrusa]